MKTMIERALTTRGKDENIMEMVVFPYNEDELKARFQVEDLKDLGFVDRPESKMSVPSFNYVIREADARAAKIEDSINGVVRFLMDKLAENPEWRGTSEEIPMNFQDGTVWNWCMKEDYKHPDEKVKVWYHKTSLTVFYGEKKQ